MDTSAFSALGRSLPKTSTNKTTTDTMDGELTRGYRDLLETGLFTDLTLVCAGREFKVHKVVLYSQSDFFRKLLGSGFREATQSTVELKGDGAEALDVLIRYFYRHHTDFTAEHTAPTTFAAKVYAIAHRYAVLSLCAQAATGFGKVLDPKVDLEDFIGTIREVDESVYAGDRTLWDMVIRVARENMGFLLAKEEFMGLLREMPSLMADLLRLLDASESVPVEATSEGLGGWRRLG